MKIKKLSESKYNERKVTAIFRENEEQMGKKMGTGNMEILLWMLSVVSHLVKYLFSYPHTHCDLVTLWVNSHNRHRRKVTYTQP